MFSPLIFIQFSLFLKDTTFFYKFHVLAGQVKPNGTSSLDFAWLTKEEISKYVDGQYWDGVKDMLSDF